MNGFQSGETKADIKNPASFDYINVKDLPTTVDWRDKVQ
jgi:hypothetical protein